MRYNISPSTTPPPPPSPPDIAASSSYAVGAATHPHPPPSFVHDQQQQQTIEQQQPIAAALPPPGTSPTPAAAVPTHVLTLPPPPAPIPQSLQEVDAVPQGHIVDEDELEVRFDKDPPHTPLEKFRAKMAENQAVINTFVAGGLAGATSRTVVSPLERLKIILQVQGKSSGASNQAYGALWPSLVRMWKSEGFAGFMKGNGINVVRILPYSAIQFTSYGAFKNLALQWSGQEVLSTPWRLASGAAAGIMAVSFTYPLDLVRARLSIATANMAHSGSAAAFTAEDAQLGIVGMTKKVYRQEGGIRGLYRGCWATAVGVAPYVSLNFYGYETLKGIILPPGLDCGDLEFAARKLSCGGLAGAFSLMFTHPFDVLRRKMQVAGLSTLGEPNVGAIETLKLMIQRDGFWRGLYRGLVPNLVKIVPSMAVSFYTFDTVSDLLAKWTHIQDEDEWA
ncbi:putative mitochondrial carrier [Vanrija pseudolonga]|uniref:Purtative mitochondrial carrier n=1 Tax=Vanrija pseudolonga TaxID=143232 RepID=A0AAF0YFB0_9TREE|nr:purtative mitochondrial carrier [Vanrija pseudolonga]WOO83900.1 purtative mitochondrial carrier [Vanrija pseudolonga]